MNPPTTSAEAAASARHARAELPALRATVARLKAALAARTRRVTALELALVRLTLDTIAARAAEDRKENPVHG